MVGAKRAMLSVSVLLPVPVVLVALIVTGKAPPTVGVPEMIPVVVSTARPAGNPVALKLVGPWVAVIW